MDRPECVKFHQNPNVNPITGSPMDMNSRSYKQLVSRCGHPPGLEPPKSSFSPRSTSPRVATTYGDIKLGSPFPDHPATSSPSFVGTSSPSFVGTSSPSFRQQTSIPYPQQLSTIPPRGSTVRQQASPVYLQQPTSPFSQRPTNLVPQQPTNMYSQQPTSPFSQRPTNLVPQQPTSPFSQSPTNLVPQQPTSPFYQRPTNMYSQQPTNIYSQQPTNMYSLQPTSPFLQRPTSLVSQQPTNMYSQQPTNVYSQQPTNMYSQQPTNMYSQQPTRPFSQRPINMFPQQPTNMYPQQPTNMYPQQPTNMYPQQPTNLVPQQPTNLVPQQPTNLVPQQSTPVAVSQQRIASPQRTVSPQRTASPQRIASPQRTVSPQRTASPERLASPQRIASPLLDFGVQGLMQPGDFLGPEGYFAQPDMRQIPESPQRNTAPSTAMYPVRIEPPMGLRSGNEIPVLQDRESQQRLASPERLASPQRVASPERPASPQRIASPPRTSLLEMPGLPQGLVDFYRRMESMRTVREVPTAPVRVNVPREGEVNAIYERVLSLQNEDPNEYIQKDIPEEDDYLFLASEQNSQVIQAGIDTAREVYPSFDLYIQAAQEANVLERFAIRGLYPSYFRDASPFELFKVYKGDQRDLAVYFLRKVMFNNYRRMDESALRIQAEDVIGYNITEEDEEMPDLNTGAWSTGYRTDSIRGGPREVFDRFMGARGYRREYLGYILADHPAARAADILHPIPLTPASFQASITPEKAMMMEAIRSEAAVGGVSSKLDKYYLDLSDATAQYGRGLLKPPLPSYLGFSKGRLRVAVLAATRNLERPKGPGLSQITRDYIRYEEDPPVERAWLAQWALPGGVGMNKTYYMMLYNELVVRGLIQ